jgi:outer membrane biosynthesis protein TonB
MQGDASSLFINNEGRLWLISFLIALLTCVLGFLFVGALSLSSISLGRQMPPRKIVENRRLLIVAPPRSKVEVESRTLPKVAEKAPKRFARTSAEQNSQVPEKADFIGNRDTVATSDATPATGVPELPSLSGKDTQRSEDIETTESSIQDGDLAHNTLARPDLSEMVKSSPSPPREKSAEPSAPQPVVAEQMPKPPDDPPVLADDPITEKEQEKVVEKKMIEGDQTVERELPKDEVKAAEKQASVDRPAEEKVAQLPKPKEQESPKKNDPGFRGNQEKTRLSGSLSRKGVSALNVADTALGRYHASLSRAVEAEWSRNCTKYRDFITPGILTLRFVIDEKGGIRSVGVVEMIDAGEVQKGFTLNAIRQSKIPPMPKDLLKELDGEPLELIYNFYF